MACMLIVMSSDKVRCLEALRKCLVGLGPTTDALLGEP